MAVDGQGRHIRQPSKGVVTRLCRGGIGQSHDPFHLEENGLGCCLGLAVCGLHDRRGIKDQKRSVGVSLVPLRVQHQRAVLGNRQGTLLSGKETQGILGKTLNDGRRDGLGDFGSRLGLSGNSDRLRGFGGGTIIGDQGIASRQQKRAAQKKHRREGAYASIRFVIHGIIPFRRKMEDFSTLWDTETFTELEKWVKARGVLGLVEEIQDMRQSALPQEFCISCILPITGNSPPNAIIHTASPFHPEQFRRSCSRP